jgi:hypothetical protein
MGAIVSNPFPDPINPMHAYPVHTEATAAHLFEPVSPKKLDPTSVADILDFDSIGGSVDASVKTFLKPFTIIVEPKSPEPLLEEPSTESLEVIAEPVIENRPMLAFGIRALGAIGLTSAKITTGVTGAIVGGVSGSIGLAGKISHGMAKDTFSTIMFGIGSILQYPTALATIPIGILIGGAIGLCSKDSTLFQGIVMGASVGFDVKEFVSIGVFGLAPGIVLGTLASVVGLVVGSGEGFFKGVLYGAGAGYDLPEDGFEKAFAGFKESLLQDFTISEKERNTILDACIKESIEYHENTK